MQRINVTLLGHKDHGKSTLIGRLLFDTTSVKEDRVAEVRATCEHLGKPFEYAFLLDSFQEEREGGMTIDVIHAQIKGERRLYDCIDVPGHKELIKNMLTGASHADAGILIVSAKEGVEEQTGHHLRLARWLGLRQLVVAVNKMDAMGYSRNVFEAMRSRVTELMEEGFLDRAAFVPVSAYEGDNVVTRSPRMGWYDGHTVFELMERFVRRADREAAPLRMPVQGAYLGPGRERVIGGRVESGSVCVGQPVCFAPSGFKATVTGLLTSQPGAGKAAAGENVGLVCDPDPGSVARGEVCCSADDLAGARSECATYAIFLEPPPTRVTVECGTARTEGALDVQEPIEVGEVVRVVLRFGDPLVVEPSMTSIGRLALKHHGKIIGVAVAV